jgi:hypothetical protein
MSEPLPDKAEIKRNPDGTIAPGSASLNPAGRPKGKTIKERIKDYLDENPEEMAKFVEYFVKQNRDLAWQMLEGRPSQALGQDPELPPLTLNVVNYGDKPSS